MWVNLQRNCCQVGYGCSWSQFVSILPQSAPVLVCQPHLNVHDGFKQGLRHGEGGWEAMEFDLYPSYSSNLNIMYIGVAWKRIDFRGRSSHPIISHNLLAWRGLFGDKVWCYPIIHVPGFCSTYFTPAAVLP